MRKLSSAIAIFVFFLLSAGHPAPVLAACTPRSGPLCPVTTNVCTVVGGITTSPIYCCTTTAECTALKSQANQQTTTGTSATAPVSSVCQFAGTQQQACNNCMQKGTATWTALGCIQTDPQLFIGEILRIAIGIGGGVAFLLILFGGFQILTSAGNPEQLTAGREVVTSAITGLLLIIFSIFLLRLIGFNIFGIPGFG